MGRIPKRVIRNPQALMTNRVTTPIDQIQQHYGGRAATEAAISDAEELARQLSAIHDFDGSGYRRMFPEVDYSNYYDDMVVNPVPADLVNVPGGNLPVGEPDGGVLMMPSDDTLRETGQIQMRTGEFIDAPDEALDMPSISYSQDMPRKRPIIFGEPQDLAMSPDELLADIDRRGEEGLRRGSVARSVEMPMTDYVTMTPLERASGMDFRSNMLGNDIDQTLAQIRRTAGAQYLEPDDARQLIDNAMGRSAILDEQGNLVGFHGRNDLDAETGLTMDRLAMLAQLPPQVRAFLPKRIRELLTLGGITTGLLSAGGESSDRRGIPASSTTGPLSGLTDY